MQISVKGNPVVIALMAFFGVAVTARIPLAWHHFVDTWTSYAGTVVEKGEEHHILIGHAFDPYIIVQDSGGHKHKHYVNLVIFPLIKANTYVVKTRGFGNVTGPYRPGQLNVYEYADSAAALVRERDPAKRDSLLAHMRR